MTFNDEISIFTYKLFDNYSLVAVTTVFYNVDFDKIKQSFGIRYKKVLHSLC